MGWPGLGGTSPSPKTRTYISLSLLIIVHYAKETAQVEEACGGYVSFTSPVLFFLWLW